MASRPRWDFGKILLQQSGHPLQVLPGGQVLSRLFVLQMGPSKAWRRSEVPEVHHVGFWAWAGQLGKGRRRTLSTAILRGMLPGAPMSGILAKVHACQVFGRRIVDFLARNVGDLKKQGGLAWLFVLPIESDAKFHPACPLCHGAHAGL